MSRDNRLICDICGKPIPTWETNGYRVWNGVEYIRVTIELLESMELPRYAPGDDDESDYPKKLDICPWCMDAVVARSKKRRFINKLMGNRNEL